MSRLAELDASCNRLTHLPPRLGDLKSLQSLALRDNLLLAVPVELTTLRLTRLDLRANRIGTLPVEMRDMTSLVELLVEDNPLTSPPASLCRRGRVHICKYLELEAIKLDRKTGCGSTATGGGTLGRRSRRSTSNNSNLSPGPPQLTDRLKHNKRQNVDSGYSTGSDCYEKRWSQEISAKSTEHSNSQSTLSTPSTISPAPDINYSEDDYSKQNCVTNDLDKSDGNKTIEYQSPRLSPCIDHLTNGNGIDDKKPLNQIQTYREYKEALKQQRAQDVPSIYRTKDDNNSYKTEPNTPTHQPTQTVLLATSRSDPTPLNSAFSIPRTTTIFDDAIHKKPVQKVTPSRTYSPVHPIMNGNNAEPKTNIIYMKPNSPIKSSNSPNVMSHDHIPASSVNNTPMVNGNNKSSNNMSKTTQGTTTSLASTAYTTSTPKSTASSMAGCGISVKIPRNISWNHRDVPLSSATTLDKLSFTMRREIDKAKEETDLINQLRNIIETRLKMVLPEDLAPALTDGVVLCHLANHIRPRSVASIHVPSPAVPKLTMARCRRNVDNFLEACRKIGVDEGRLCSSIDVTEALCGRGLPRLLDTVQALICHLDDDDELARQTPLTTSVRCQHQPATLHDRTVSLLLLITFLATILLLVLFPPPSS